MSRWGLMLVRAAWCRSAPEYKPMNTPAIAVASPTKDTTAPVSTPKSGKPQLRMARAPMEDAAPSIPATSAPPERFDTAGI